MKVELLFFYFLNIFGTILSSKDISYSFLFKSHLQLHINHCGDVAQCDNGTNHVETSALVIPIPCCLHCSCLPTCGGHTNCCPSMWNNTEMTKDGEKLLSPKQVKTSGHEIRIRSNETGNITHGSTNVNELQTSNSEIREEDLVYRNQTGNVVRKAEEKPDPVTDTEHALDLLDDDLMSMQGRIEQKHGFNSNVETVCIRPQISYEPNIFLDSKAYMMVARCKPGYKNTSIIEKCKAGMENKILVDMIPITSSISGLTYLNKYCLMCNELETFDSTVIDEWDAIVVVYSVQYRYIFVLNPNSLIDDLKNFNFGANNLHFAPRKKTIAHQCMAYDINSCNQTGLWEKHNDLIEAICHHGYSLPVLHSINNKNLLFKNIACVHCNSDGDFHASALSCKYLEDVISKPYLYSLTVNVKSVDADGSYDKAAVKEHFTSKPILEKTKSNSCPPGFVDLMGRCRRVICPRDYYMMADRCVPLYDVITGLDLNVKIQITPRENIPIMFSLELVDALKNIVNNSVIDTVSLQFRDIAVFSYPYSNKNPKQYYLFDMFFFNSSDSIEYNVAVGEIKDLFKYLKSHKIHTLSNGAEIGLEYEFIHKIKPKFNDYYDTSAVSANKLRPLMGKGLKLKDQRAHMVISDVNWCLRTAFDTRSETERIDRYTYTIKRTDITVYGLQYDTDQFVSEGKTSYILYICIDLFSDYIDVNKRHPHIRSGNGLDGDYIDDVSKSDGKVGVIIVSVLTTLLLGILLYIVQFTLKKKNIQTALQDSPNIGNNDDVQ